MHPLNPPRTGDQPPQHHQPEQTSGGAFAGAQQPQGDEQAIQPGSPEAVDAQGQHVEFGSEPPKASDQPKDGAVENQEREENPELYAEMQNRGLRDSD